MSGSVASQRERVWALGIALLACIAAPSRVFVHQPTGSAEPDTSILAVSSGNTMMLQLVPIPAHLLRAT